MRILVALSLSFLTIAADAKTARRAPRCEGTQAKSTMYFVPQIKDDCPSPTPCAKFKSSVRLQGSGILNPTQNYVYVGATRRRAAHYEVQSNKGCPTARGASGDCLMPFLSVAADRGHYRMGDIVEMPGLKDKEIPLPDGRILKHPGYVIVQDVGGAIRGPNRFDFFTGTYRMGDKGNRFGLNGDLSMCDKNTCGNHKRMGATIRLSKKDPKYLNALAAIQNANTSAAKPNAQMASASGDEGTHPAAANAKEGKQ